MTYARCAGKDIFFFHEGKRGGADSVSEIELTTACDGLQNPLFVMLETLFLNVDAYWFSARLSIKIVGG